MGLRPDQPIATVAFGSLLIFCVFSTTLRHAGASPEAHAIAALKSLQSAQVMFAASCGNGGYAASIEELSAPLPSVSDAFLPPDYTQSLANAGYRITMQAGSQAAKGPTSCLGATTRTEFVVAATPLSGENRDRHSFATETSGLIWQTEAGSLPVSFPPQGATLIR